MESRRKIISVNALSLLIAQVVSRLATFIASIYLIRYLGVLNYGKYSTIIAYVGLFTVIADLGLSQLIIREVAQDKSKAGHYFGNFIILQTIITFIIFISLSIIINFFNYPKDIVIGVYLFGLSLFVTSLSTPFSSIVAAFERMKISAFSYFISTVITAVLILYVALTKSLNLPNLMMIYSVGPLIGLIFILIYTVKNVVKPIFKIDLNLWLKLIKLAFPFALVSALSVIYNKIDILMLSKMKDEVIVGIYSAAYRFIDIWWVIPIAINNAFYPHLSRQFKQNRLMLIKNVRRLFFGQAAIGILISLVIYFFSPVIITYLFGSKFSQSTELLRILIWYVPLNFAAGSFANILMAIGKTTKFAIASGINVILVISLNYLLIPKLSYFGTSLTTLMSGLVLLGICGYFVWKEKLL